MHIIVAPDSFKESLSSIAVATEIEKGFQEIYPDAVITKIPIADGGEGTVEALVMATGGKTVMTEVLGPLGESVASFYGVSGDNQSVIIEMAAASGLHLVPLEERNPLKTTSYGTGELIRCALDAGYRKFIIGIGGSATNDAGAGMLQALGVRLLDKDDREIGLGGESLAHLAKIDITHMDPRIRESSIDVACDVNNPLTGPNGASAIFGPQKGATPQMVETLDRCLAHFAEVIKRDLSKEVDQFAGAGAAGGTGAALQAFLGATLTSGVDMVLAHTGFAQRVQHVDLVITGEGRIDGQSIFGKAPVGIARVAQTYGVPTIAFAGSLGQGVSAVKEYGIVAVFSVVNTPCSLQEALSKAKDNVYTTAKNVAAAMRLSEGFGSCLSRQKSV